MPKGHVAISLQHLAAAVHLVELLDPMPAPDRRWPHLVKLAACRTWPRAPAPLVELVPPARHGASGAVPQLAALHLVELPSRMFCPYVRLDLWFTWLNCWLLCRLNCWLLCLMHSS